VSLFVSFEGPDGAGKSTQVKLVSERLQQANFEILVTREPGGTPLGERVRSVLLDPGDCAIVPRAEALLMTAARAQHVDDVIRPALRRGVIVLCDRFIDSTLAYQGAGRGLPEPDLMQIQEFAIQGCGPDLTVLLDLPSDEGIRRRETSGTPLNRLDQDTAAFHERVRTWYVQAALHDPKRWVRFDARRDADELATEITALITHRHQIHEADTGANRMSK
jgi:dTMP kinase